MRKTRLPLAVSLLLLLGLPLVAWGEFPTSRPFAGVMYGQESRRNPAMKLHWVILDLNMPGISLHVSRGGPDPDGNGPFQTTLMVTSEVAARDGFDIAINGDFFAAQSKVDQDGALLRYAAGQPALVMGPAMTDGQLWAKSSSVRPTLVVTDKGNVMIGPSNKLPGDARQVVAGNSMLVEGGKRVGNSSAQLAPRTAVGLDKDGKRLVMLVVDGRLPGYSMGMTYAQLADEMIRLGCHTALNLDGGGSTTLVMRDPQDQKHKTLNSPSEGKQRAVANVLGVKIKPAERRR